MCMFLCVQGMWTWKQEDSLMSFLRSAAPCFLERGSPTGLEWSNRLGWPPETPRDLPVFPALGTVSVHCHSWLFTRKLSLVFSRQAIYWLNHHPKWIFNEWSGGSTSGQQRKRVHLGVAKWRSLTSRESWEGIAPLQRSSAKTNHWQISSPTSPMRAWPVLFGLPWVRALPWLVERPHDSLVATQMTMMQIVLSRLQVGTHLCWP